jgi:sodium-dependent phosphate cotransporter
MDANATTPHTAPRITQNMARPQLNSQRLAQIILRLLGALIVLYIFLVGVKTLGSGIKLLGGGFAEGLLTVTSNPGVGIAAGLLATALFQSSSVTTSLIVGMVSSGALPVVNAVPMIMGANIGTSVTNTFVSLGSSAREGDFKRAFAAATVHDFFNLLTVMIALPIELMTGFLSKSATAFAGVLWGTSEGLKYNSAIKAAIKPSAAAVQSAVAAITPESISGATLIIVSFAIIVAALTAVVKIMKSLVESQAAPFITKALGHPVIALLAGIVVTISVQSSSITTSLLVPMAGSGLLTLQTILPITIGANIGTTATALLAAFAGNIHGLTIALVHLFFNLFGTIIFFSIKPLRRVPVFCAEAFAGRVASSKVYAVAYIGLVFFGLPLLLVSI